jgi:hypothetical protein
MDSNTTTDRQPSEAAEAPSAPADGTQDLQPLDDLADVEFLLEGIEDKIAPLA